MTAISAPSTHAQLDSAGATYAFWFAQQAIEQALAERLNALDAGLARFYGDLTGSGSDTLRITSVDNIGWAEAMSAPGETSAVSATGYDVVNDDITVARYSLEKTQSYMNRALLRSGGIDLDTLVSSIADSWFATLMTLVCSTGATISTSKGTTNTAWTVDDEISLVSGFMLTEGYAGGAVTVRHPEQYEDLRASLRTEAAYKFPEAFAATQTTAGVGFGRPGGGLDNWLGLNNFMSHKVNQSSPDHVGFAYGPGGIGFATADMGLADVNNPAQSIRVPQYGLVVEISSNPSTGVSKATANCLLGVALRDTTVAPQFKLLSVDD